MRTGPGFVRQRLVECAGNAPRGGLRSPRAVAAVLGGVLGAAGLGIGAGTWGCGASYQAMYEGEVRFEHCYRLDEEPNVPLPQRRECWREWTQFYTYGQTRDRIEYALMRQRVLAGQTGNSATDTSAANGGQEPTATLVAPPPTNLFAPPPQVDSASPRPPAPVPAASVAPVPSPDDLAEMVTDGNAPPGQSCLLRCVGAWRKCTGNCLNDNARCRATCDSAFKACGRGCI